jgi:MFS family permease
MTECFVAGSIAYICQPFGSLTSGMLMEWLGRKRLMILLNLPFLAGWVLICTAPNYAVLCFASVVVGITVGLAEAPINSYIGEVCQPEIRGMMTACAGNCEDNIEMNLSGVWYSGIIWLPLNQNGTQCR